LAVPTQENQRAGVNSS